MGFSDEDTLDVVIVLQARMLAGSSQGRALLNAKDHYHAGKVAGGPRMSHRARTTKGAADRNDSCFLRNKIIEYYD
jgi:hypothetical protein